MLRDPSAQRPWLHSKINLLGNAESIVDLDVEIADGAFQFPMPQQELDGAQIARNGPTDAARETYGMISGKP
jgi:hypothetical protein